jgi:zinc-binding alcohol dehydrogenase family protein
MKAVGYRASLPITKDEALIDFEMPPLDPGPRDLRVSVRAVSVNPVDTKVRLGMAPASGETRILGFDAAGVVESVGSMVSLFRPGDEVFYAGAIDRPGSDSELHLVDERIAGRKPRSLSFAEAAALPLTSITAWELLFDRLGVPYGRKDQSGVLLVVNGAGGVGSILTQLARRLTGLRVVATASRPETIAWCQQMGAHDVIDHRRKLDEALGEIGLSTVAYIAGLTATEKHMPAFTRAIAPQGKLAVIDDPKVLDVVPFKRKCASVHWEYMFARPVFQTADMIAQHRLLNEVADLVDAGVLRTTMTANAGPIRAANLRSVHATVESGRALGKTVLAGF